MNLFVDGIVYNRDNQGGIPRMYTELLPRLCEAEPSLDVTLFLPELTHLSLPNHKNISEVTIPTHNPILMPAFIWDLVFGLNRDRIIKQKARSSKRSIWHSTYFTTARQWNGPVVLTVYDMIYERFPSLFNTKADKNFIKTKRKCFDRADVVICISETTRNELLERYGGENKIITSIPLACTDSFKKLDGASFKKATQKRYLLYVGSRAHYKNFTFLIKAYSHWDFVNDIDLLVVGSPWTTQEQQLIDELHLTDHIRLLGECNDDELCELYNDAAAFVYPSLFEGFGIPLLEAMACECPIVASEIPSTIEVASNYPYYFDPTNPASLLQALNQVVSGGKDINRILLGKNILKLYSWEKTAKKYLEVYRSLS